MPNFGDIQVGGLPLGQSAKLETGHQIAIGPGQLWSLTALNFNTSNAGLILLLDQTADPTGYSSTTVAPIYANVIAVGSATNGPGVLAPAGIPALYFTNGLWVLLSSVITTPFTATAMGPNGAFCWQVTAN